MIDIYNGDGHNGGGVMAVMGGSDGDCVNCR